MLIGAGMTLPFAWGKFYMPHECTKNILHMVNDLAEAVLYYFTLNFNQYGWIMPAYGDLDSYMINRNAFYFFIDMTSIVFALPSAYNTCQS